MGMVGKNGFACQPKTRKFGRLIICNSVHMMQMCHQADFLMWFSCIVFQSTYKSPYLQLVCTWGKTWTFRDENFLWACGFLIIKTYFSQGAQNTFKKHYFQKVLYSVTHGIHSCLYLKTLSDVNHPWGSVDKLSLGIPLLWTILHINCKHFLENHSNNLPVGHQASWDIKYYFHKEL